jgi:hypothetical protein
MKYRAVQAMAFLLSWKGEAKGRSDGRDALAMKERPRFLRSLSVLFSLLLFLLAAREEQEAIERSVLP